MPTHALDSITIKGFKSIASVEVALRPINLLIGPNGSGKSNFIGVFSFLHAIREGRLQNYVTAAGGAEKILHYGSKATPQLSLLISFGDGANQYELILEAGLEDNLFPSQEFASFFQFHSRLWGRKGGREAGISDPKLAGVKDKKTENWVHDWLGSWRIYHVHDTSTSSTMRKTAKLNDNAYLRPDGSNLAAFLYFLKEKHEASFEFIQRTVRRVAPFFEAFRLEPLRLNPNTIKLEWRHQDSDQYFDASSLSDGTLRFIALATLFLQPKSLRPPVILIDEPELGLHPYAIELLASLIRQVSTETQVVVSTQSSLLLDHFEPEDVLVANRVDGGTQLQRLKSSDLSQWLEDYSLGQLWEKNEIGGRPGPE